MNNQIPVKIANISDKKIILKKNEVLGRCEPVERVVKCEEINGAQLNQAKVRDPTIAESLLKNAAHLEPEEVEDEWSSEELKKSQKKDSDLKLIRNWVKNGVRPTWQEVSRYGTTIKGYWAQWSSLCLRDGLLHRKWESPMEYPQSTRDWDKLVPLFLLSYRSSQHESTTYTPSMLTSGREMKLPTDLMLGRPLEETEERSLPEFVEDLRKRTGSTLRWTGSTDLPGRS
ncbi:hypothetical protein NQ318_023368 [Aromia moschata]|uniref:Uncharacterized protein n=1 Tax=Aromia moschata TaxID=1265417 RepID=A0AAV8XB56_9CUCU|nr:hypothetical protein NQ318_023368 [Aromia moschata]